MQINSLEEKFIYELNGIYDAETRFLEAQQHMIRQTRNEPFQLMLLDHIHETQQQIQNLKLVFKLIDRHPKPVESETMTGLITDAQQLMQQTAINPDLLEAVIVEAQTKMKYVEIVSYRGLIKATKQIEQPVITSLLGQNLQQAEHILQQFEEYFYAMPNSGTRIRPV